MRYNFFKVYAVSLFYTVTITFGGVILASKKIMSERSMTVATSNELIQKKQFLLKAQEHKILLYLVSKLKPDDVSFQEITVNTAELCDCLGISYNGKNEKDMKDAIKYLSDTSYWVDFGDKQQLCRWLAKVVFFPRSATFSCRFDEDLMPYLLQLNKRYVSYELVNVLAMQSQYSIRVYQLLKSYCELGKWTFQVKDLREHLGIAKCYATYKEFRRNVLDKALKEINNFTDITVAYTPIRKNGAYTEIQFYITDHLLRDNDFSRRKLNRDIALGEASGDVVEMGQVSVAEVEKANIRKRRAKEQQEMERRFLSPSFEMDPDSAPPIF